MAIDEPPSRARTSGPRGLAGRREAPHEVEQRAHIDACASEGPAAAVNREVEMTRFNREIEPLLSEVGSVGVVAAKVSTEAAAKCANYLQAHWVSGKLSLGSYVTATGFTTYDKVLDAHDSEKQRLHTLLITNSMLPLARRRVEGFADIEAELIEWLHTTCVAPCATAAHRSHVRRAAALRAWCTAMACLTVGGRAPPPTAIAWLPSCGRYGTVVELFFAHGLRQGPETLQSTGFDVHQDTEDYDFIEVRVPSLPSLRRLSLRIGIRIRTHHPRLLRPPVATPPS